MKELRKDQKGRRKKKRICNEMDDSKGWGDDMYGFGDFDDVR